MPKVLITGFCHLPGPNRAGVQLGHVLGALSGKHSVDVLVVRKGDQAYVERQGAARILRVPLSEEGIREQIDAFRRALRRQLEGADYDIVHFRDGWAGAPILEMRDRLGYATVFDAARGPMADAALIDLELADELARDEETCILAADSVLVPTEHAAAHIARIRPDRVHVVPPGVDVDLFDWDELTETGRPVVLYAGSMEPGRGVRVLLRAMVEVAAKTPAQLVLAGDASPAFQAHIARAVDDLELTGRVDVVGPIPHEDMPALIAQATVCVAPAAAELTARPGAIYPTKLLEYMACRRAVVAPRRGTVNLLLRGGKEGLLFAPGDPIDLAAVILRILGDAALRQRLAQTGYEMVRLKHTASAARRALRQAYAVLVERAQLPPRTDAVASLPPRPASMERTDEIFEHELEAIAGDITAVELAVLSDETREGYDSGAWTMISTPAIEPEEDGGDDGTVIANSPPAAPAPEGFAEALDDEWVVAESRMTRPETWSSERVLDDEGTPIDIAPVEPAPLGSPAENRFVAGEVYVPDFVPELADETAFTAVSVLLGSGDETAPRESAPGRLGPDTAIAEPALARLGPDTAPQRPLDRPAEAAGDDETRPVARPGDGSPEGGSR